MPGTTITDPKTYLRKYRESKRLIQSLLDDIEQHTTTINAVCKPPSDVDVQRSPNGNAAEKHVISLIDTKSKKHAVICANVAICLQVEYSISIMPCGMHRTILYNHYIRGESFETIAEQTGMYCMKIWRLHGEALKIWEEGIK